MAVVLANVGWVKPWEEQLSQRDDHVAERYRAEEGSHSFSLSSLEIFQEICTKKWKMKSEIASFWVGKCGGWQVPSGYCWWKYTSTVISNIRTALLFFDDMIRLSQILSNNTGQEMFIFLWSLALESGSNYGCFWYIWEITYLSSMYLFMSWWHFSNPPL